MATLTATRAADDFPAFQPHSGSGLLCAAYGSYDLAANPSAADVLEMCKVPKGAVILFGFLRGEDIDTGAATLDIDVGTATDTDAFGNFGVLNGTAVTNYLPEGGFLIPLHGTLKDGPVPMTQETKIQLLINAVAATFAAGTVTLVVCYVNPL
jgi:hypothetical protein